jgi:hypothetical protein
VNAEQVKKALIISVSHYDDKELDTLDLCENDGMAMYDVLTSQKYDIPNDRKLIGYVKYEEMRSAIINFFTNPNVRATDKLLFYFSGHGIPTGSGKHFIASSEVTLRDHI